MGELLGSKNAISVGAVGVVTVVVVAGLFYVLPQDEALPRDESYTAQGYSCSVQCVWVVVVGAVWAF